jgi:signal transduction histidine kinase
MKTQTKIAFSLGCAGITIVLLFGVSIYYFLDKYSYVDFYERLEARVRITTALQFVEEGTEELTLRKLREVHLAKLTNEQEWVIQRQPGVTVEALAAQYGPPAEFWEALVADGGARGRQGKLFFAGSVHREGDADYFVVVSADNYFVTHHLVLVRNIVLVTMAAMAVLVVWLSVYFSRRIFEPIRTITDRVKQIRTQNIHLRLEANGNNDVITELVNTFNDLLNRIETTFETQKNFISNASHELGTPLTAIIGEADVALLKARDPAAYQASLRHILHQAERLGDITRSLLFLAQASYRDKVDAFEMLRIDEVIWETKGVIDKLNPQHQIAIDLSLLPDDPKKLKVKGNRQLLQLAFANVLNNGCKYSNNGPVTVFIASTDTHVVVTIKDRGIGIPDEEIALIFEPFFRASNTQLFEGFGIGLPLSRNIVLLHKGSLEVSSAIGLGTTVQIKLPLLKMI